MHLKVCNFYEPIIMHPHTPHSCVCNYRCMNERHGIDFHFDDLCMSGVGTIKLRSGLQEREIVFATYENEVQL